MTNVDLGAVWARALGNFLNENVPIQQRTWLGMVRPIALADDTIEGVEHGGKIRA